MSQRTWTCVTCRKSYRRSQDAPAMRCPVCDEPCEYVHWKVRIPSPRRPKAWAAFWNKYRAEKALLDAHARGDVREPVRLEVLNLTLRLDRPTPSPDRPRR